MFQVNVNKKDLLEQNLYSLSMHFSCVHHTSLVQPDLSEDDDLQPVSINNKKFNEQFIFLKFTLNKCNVC